MERGFESMTVHSNTEPAVIFIDKIEAGIARLLVHWNIQQVSVPDPMTGETRQEWQYSERVIKWTLPQKYDSTDEVLTYLTGIQAEILNWAEATEMNT
jgi:hypothetical protein